MVSRGNRATTPPGAPRNFGDDARGRILPTRCLNPRSMRVYGAGGLWGRRCIVQPAASKTLAA
jgi:hypothetical protein